jgi:hypothetical protein
MYERQHTTAQLTRAAVRAAGASGTADMGQRAADLARFRAALTGGSAIGLRERIDRRRVAARVA